MIPLKNFEQARGFVEARERNLKHIEVIKGRVHNAISLNHDGPILITREEMAALKKFLVEILEARNAGIDGELAKLGFVPDQPD